MGDIRFEALGELTVLSWQNISVVMRVLGLRKSLDPLGQDRFNFGSIWHGFVNQQTDKPSDRKKEEGSNLDENFEKINFRESLERG